MTCTVVDFAKDRTVFNFTGCTRDELENKLNLFFTSEGYKFKAEKAGGKIFTKGNLALRIILGAFWKYFRIAVSIKGENNIFSVQVLRDASGFAGGAIGVAQVRKEFNRLIEAFKVYFAS
jgi:hypothetical protein